MSDELALDVQIRTVTCPGHGEHLRAGWPTGFVPFSLAIVKATLAAPAFLEAYRESGPWFGSPPAAGEPMDFDVTVANAILATRPCCYFLTREDLRAAYDAAGIAKIGTCCGCGRSGLGAPYTARHGHRSVAHPHVCFECALDVGEELHRRYPAGGLALWR